MDIGCGIGGSSRYLARKYGCSVKGITLSPKQAQRAGEISAKAGLADKVSFQVGGGRGIGKRGWETCWDGMRVSARV